MPILGDYSFILYITAYEKACFFSQEVLDKISKGMPDGASLQMVHLIQICREAGQ